MGKHRRRGLLNQRDRGRRKKHHKSRSVREDDWRPLFDQFEGWLNESMPLTGDDRVAPSQSFSLDRFLQTSPGIGLEPDEKLRQLAIHWEDECADMAQPAGWQILKRIYRKAIQIDPNWPHHYHSCSLSARMCTSRVAEASPEFLLILRDAEQACLDGLAVVPEASSLHLSLGRIHYERRETVDALECFDQTLRIDPTEGWAVLFRAHCLHDLERWTEAVDAYRAVDRSFFDGRNSWRAVLVRDQIAACLYESGDHNAALAEFDVVFRQYEANPGLLYGSRYVEKACQWFPQTFGTRGIALFKREDFPESARRAELAMRD